MLVFIASIIDAGGPVPMFGDADDGCAVRLDPRASFCRYHSLLATGAVLFGRGALKAKARRLDDKTRWLLGRGAHRAFGVLSTSQARLPIRREFPEGGYYILGCDFETSREIRLIADAGPLGYREIAAHGHADALSFTLSVGGDEFLVDPGTFAYHTQPAWRAYFRGTAAHNTLRVDGTDQSQPGGNFMWLRKAAAGCARWTTSAATDFFEGWHDGYLALADPVLHRRRILLDKHERRILVEDELQMEGEHDVELFFHCHEDCVVEMLGDAVRVRNDARSIRIHWPRLRGARCEVLRGSLDPIGGWVSRAYDRRQPSPTLVWRARIAGPCVLDTAIDCQ